MQNQKLANLQKHCKEKNEDLLEWLQRTVLELLHTNKCNEETVNKISRKTVACRLKMQDSYSSFKTSHFKAKPKGTPVVYETCCLNWHHGIQFSDESKFNIFGSDIKTFIHYRTSQKLCSQCVKKAVKFDGSSVIMWGRWFQLYKLAL